MIYKNEKKEVFNATRNKEMKLKYQTLSLFDKIATHFYVHCVECDAIVIMPYTLMYFMTGGSIFEHFFFFFL